MTLNSQSDLRWVTCLEKVFKLSHEYIRLKSLHCMQWDPVSTALPRDYFPDFLMDSLTDAFSLSTDKFINKLCSIVATYRATKFGQFVHVDTDAGCHVSEISDATETATQVTPNWLDLSNTEKYRVHESEDIEGHLLGRESANSVRLNFLSNHIGLVHESGATSPAKRRFRIANLADDDKLTQ